MQFLGGVEGMKFTPITNYNSFLNANKSFEVDSGSEFENILNQQTMAMQNPTTIQGGVEVSKNFEDVMSQASVQAANNDSPTTNFLNSFSNSVGGGLNSVNDSVNAANKAQEALAMGEDVSVHDVMIAAEKASLNLSMATQLRNKMVSAYTEINNIRV